MKRIVIILVGVVCLLPASGASADLCLVNVDQPNPPGDGEGWLTAYVDLQDALNDVSCTEVWVARGTYQPTKNPTPSGHPATFQLRSNLELYGGFLSGMSSTSQRDIVANETILSGDILDNDGPDFTLMDDNVYHVVTASGTDATCIIDGFTITGGNNDQFLPDCNTTTEGMGAGLIVFGTSQTVDGGTPIVRNCILRNNSARLAGGMLAHRASPSIINCTFEDNRATDHWGGALEITGSCSTATFGGARVDGCTFINNRSKVHGGAVTVGNAAGVVIANSVFVGNVMESGSEYPSAFHRGGGLYIGCSENCTWSNRTRVVNCTFVDNVAAASSGRGGGMYTDTSWPIIENCVFWGNQDANGQITQYSQIRLYDPTLPQYIPLVQYCAIEGLERWGIFHDEEDVPPGSNIGNIGYLPEHEPDFVCRPAGDVRLRIGSPGNDAGRNESALGVGLTVDRDSEMRFDEDFAAPNTGDGIPPLVDMGAYEFNPFACVDAEDCGDKDLDGIVDDACLWYECRSGAYCVNTPRTFADAGGQFGACPTDGFCNVHDKNHVLACFAGTNPCDGINMDLGGSFGACPPDGWCNIHDWYHANNCFKGTSPCSCPSCGSGWSAMMGPGSGGATGLAAVPVPVSLSPNAQRVRIFTTGALADIQGYQLDPILSGGTAGNLELLDITIEPRADFVFAGRTDTYEAFNLTNGQMLCGVDGDGVATTGPAYLATYTYRVPLTAVGDFVLDIRRDEPAGDQTFLIASGNGRIEVSATTPGVVSATPAVIP